VRAATVCAVFGCTETASSRDGRCDRHRRRGGRPWRRLRAVVLARDRHRCVTCGRPASEVDHLDPLVLGGRELVEPGRLASACAEHNARGTAGVGADPLRARGADGCRLAAEKSRENAGGPS
jgi:5-methylcytosine-specific restriction protein A